MNIKRYTSMEKKNETKNKAKTEERKKKEK